MQIRINHLCWLVACLVAIPSFAQSPAAQSVSSGQIAATKSALRAEAERSHQAAAKLLEKYPDFYTSLIYRNRTGGVEIHKLFDEIVVVIDGEAAVRTDGTPDHVRTVAPGELRGQSATGASSTLLTAYAVVTIPAGTPHQVVVPDGGHVTYLDVKIEHAEKNARPQ